MEWFVTCPIFLERQFDKTRMSVQYQDIQVSYLQAPFARQGITQNELSGRYRTIPDRPYKLPQDVLRILGRTSQHLSSIEPNRFESTPQGHMEHVVEVWDELLDNQHKAYQEALDSMRKAEKDGAISNAEYKRAREVVRGLLGTVYLTDMRLVMNANAFEWIVTQRIDEHAQLEARVFAYLLLVGARDNKVASAMIDAMIEKHGWQKQIDEIETILKEEK